MPDDLPQNLRITQESGVYLFAEACIYSRPASHQTRQSEVFDAEPDRLDADDGDQDPENPLAGVGTQRDSGADQ